MKTVQQKWFGFVIVVLAILLCLGGLVMSGTVFSAAGPQCLNNEDGTITETYAYLMWQEQTAGPMDWDAAMSYASGLSLGGHSDWRLPTKQELDGLLNSDCKNLMDVKQDDYWSSTTSGNSRAWRVSFLSNNLVNTGTRCKSNTYYVRAVHLAQ